MRVVGSFLSLPARPSGTSAACPSIGGHHHASTTNASAPRTTVTSDIASTPGTMSSKRRRKAQTLKEMLRGYPLTLMTATSFDQLRHQHKSRQEHDEMLQRCEGHVDSKLDKHVLRMWKIMRKPKDNFPNMGQKYPGIDFPITLRAWNSRRQLEHWAKQIETQKELIAKSRHQVHCHVSKEASDMQAHYAMKLKQRERAVGMHESPVSRRRRRRPIHRPQSASAAIAGSSGTTTNVQSIIDSSSSTFSPGPDLAGTRTKKNALHVSVALVAQQLNNDKLTSSTTRIWHKNSKRGQSSRITDIDSYSGKVTRSHRRSRSLSRSRVTTRRNESNAAGSTVVCAGALCIC